MTDLSREKAFVMGFCAYDDGVVPYITRQTIVMVASLRRTLFFTVVIITQIYT